MQPEPRPMPTRQVHILRVTIGVLGIVVFVSAAAAVEWPLYAVMFGASFWINGASRWYELAQGRPQRAWLWQEQSLLAALFALVGAFTIWLHSHGAGVFWCLLALFVGVAVHGAASRR